MQYWTVCVHCPVSLAVGVTSSAWLPEWTLPTAELAVLGHDQPDKPDSKPGFTIGFVAALAGRAASPTPTITAAAHKKAAAPSLSVRIHR